MKAYSTQKLAKYYRKKFGWDETTYDRVNWEAIQRARAKLAPEQQKFVTKMFINWLPLNNRTEKYMGGSSPACIACQQPETHNHLYQCAQQNTWKIDFLSKLKALLFEMETLPEVRLTILSALQEELDDTPQQQRQQEGAHSAKLKWTDFMKGRIDVASENQIHPAHRKHWTVKIIVFMLRQLHALWELRNQSQHGTDGEYKDAYNRQEAKATITALYELRKHVREYDRDRFFSLTLEQMMEKSTKYLTDWVAIVQPAVKKARPKTQNW